MLGANEILDRIIKLRGLRSDTALANIFGVKQNTVSTWRSRGTIPYSAIIKLCNKEGVSLDSLFTAHPYIKIGERLKQLRGRKTQAILAEKLGIPLELYQSYELGDKHPSLSTLRKICILHDVPVDWLVQGNGVQPDDWETSYLAVDLSKFVRDLEQSCKREKRTILPDEREFIDWTNFVQGLNRMREERLRTLKLLSIKEEDIPVANIKEWLNVFWEKASNEERVWLDIQFRKCFPEYVEWVRANKDSSPFIFKETTDEPG
jgi:transcriptional regulator with XRE-family HTH domain